jgi:hypothetical protein
MPSGLRHGFRVNPRNGFSVSRFPPCTSARRGANLRGDPAISISISRIGVPVGKAPGDLMTRIIVIGICLALMVGVVAADAQGVGYPPGFNPSNPQDLTYRSNPQDLIITVPGGNNRQDGLYGAPHVCRENLQGSHLAPASPSARPFS